jgi:hypothetical protein
VRDAFSREGWLMYSNRHRRDPDLVRTQPIDVSDLPPATTGLHEEVKFLRAENERLIRLVASLKMKGNP